MDRLFNTMVDRTRSRLDVPKVRTLFGSKGRPHRNRQRASPRQAVVIEKPRWNLTIFKVHFGLLTLKAYTKGERVLRFEAIAHHTKQLGCGRRLDKFPQIITRLTGMVDRFTSMLDCVELGFLPDGILDELPPPPSSPQPGSAASTSTRPGSGPRSPQRSPSRSLRPASPSPSSPPKSGDDRTDPRGLQHPPGRLRPAQAPRQTARHQTRPNPPLPRPRARRTHDRRATHPPRQGHRPILAGIRTPRRGRPRRTGPPSTATTKPSAAKCRPCSTTSASPPAQLLLHRQHFADRRNGELP